MNIRKASRGKNKLQNGSLGAGPGSGGDGQAGGAFRCLILDLDSFSISGALASASIKGAKVGLV